MRIGILCHAGCGGSGMVATESAHELAGRGHEVHLFSRRTPFAFRDHPRLKLHALKARNEPDPGTLHIGWSREEQRALIERMCSVARNVALDLIHFHYAAPFGFLADEFRRTVYGRSIPIVGTLHGTDVSLLGADPRQRLELGDVLRRVDALTTVSLDYARRAAHSFNLPTHPAVIPNFVDLHRIRAARADRALRDRNRPVMAHVSNFRPVKDPLVTLRIFAGILEQMDAELWLIGDGAEMGAVRRFVQQYGLDRHVRFFGFRGNVFPLLKQSDLFILSSREESFSLAALEAMACGVPVLAPRVGGLTEVIVDGQTGLLFPPGDINRATALAVGLLSRPRWRQKLGEAGAVHARYFDRGRAIGSYEQLYADVIERKGSARLSATSAA